MQNLAFKVGRQDARFVTATRGKSTIATERKKTQETIILCEHSYTLSWA
jgi:hypothetical protein